MVNTDCYFIIIIIMLILGFGEHNRKKAFSRDLQAGSTWLVGVVCAESV